MQLDIPSLEKAVRTAVNRSPVSAQVKDVTLEADRDDEGSAFLRVIVRLDIEKATDAQIDDLADSIEVAVSALDDRFPSVRFVEAA